MIKYNYIKNMIGIKNIKHDLNIVNIIIMTKYNKIWFVKYILPLIHTHLSKFS